MDQHQKQLSSMDPKLKEAYDQVMNSPVAPASTQSPGSLGSLGTSPMPTSPPQPKAEGPLAQIGTNTQPVQGIEPIQPPSVAPITPPPPVVAPSMGANPLPGVQQPGQTVHIDYTLKKPASSNVTFGRKKLGIPPALYIVGCILFFILYTLFWLKVFGLPIPYLG